MVTINNPRRTEDQILHSAAGLRILREAASSNKIQPTPSARLISNVRAQSGSDMTARIHLIERQGRLTPVQPGSQEYESGFWKVAEKTAQKLVGGEILFHKAQAKPAFFGGVIQSYRVQPDGKWQGKIIFRFIADPALRGTLAGQGGWGMEKKIVL